MFVRTKKSGAYQYLQVVHNERVDGKVRQWVLAALGRLDVLRETGQIDALIVDGIRGASGSDRPCAAIVPNRLQPQRGEGL